MPELNYKAYQAKHLIIMSEGRCRSMYYDDNGNPTIGIGHLILQHEQWLMDANLTDQQIDDMFDADAIDRVNWINKNCCNWQVPMRECDFIAIMDWCWQYDINNPKYEHTKLAIIRGNRDVICEHLLQFTNIKVEDGDHKLKPRRMREINFLTM